MSEFEAIILISLIFEISISFIKPPASFKIIIPAAISQILSFF